MFRSSGTHELHTKWPRSEARRPRLRVVVVVVVIPYAVCVGTYLSIHC